MDAYPEDIFHGVVKQIRLNPVIDQNVVTYAAIVSAPNPELKLRPGMTANVTVEVSRRDNVLRVPNAALRFEPGDDLLASLGQATATVPKRAPVTRNSGGSTNQPARSNVSKVWIFDSQLHRVPVVVGASDGTLTEVRLPPDAPSDEDLAEGSHVAIGMTTPGAHRGPVIVRIRESVARVASAPFLIPFSTGASQPVGQHRRGWTPPHPRRPPFLEPKTNSHGGCFLGLECNGADGSGRIRRG